MTFFGLGFCHPLGLCQYQGRSRRRGRGDSHRPSHHHRSRCRRRRRRRARCKGRTLSSFFFTRHLCKGPFFCICPPARLFTLMSSQRRDNKITHTIHRYYTYTLHARCHDAAGKARISLSLFWFCFSPPSVPGDAANVVGSVFDTIHVFVVVGVCVITTYTTPYRFLVRISQSILG